MTIDVEGPTSATLGYTPSADPHLTMYPVAPALGSQARVTACSWADATAGMSQNANVINSRQRRRDERDMGLTLRGVRRLKGNWCARAHNRARPQFCQCFRTLAASPPKRPGAGSLTTASTDYGNGRRVLKQRKGHAECGF